jgi:hypothetical protein
MALWSCFARVVVNTLTGAVAGAVPASVWMAWEEWTVGFNDGLGGIAWVVALCAGVLLGGLAGAVLGVVGRGVREIGFGSGGRVLLGAGGGALLGAVAGRQVAGLGDERGVAAVLLAQTAGLVLGMLLLTAPRQPGQAALTRRVEPPK